MFEGMAVRGNTHLGILLESHLRLASDVLHVELVWMDTNLCLVNKARKIFQYVQKCKRLN